MKRQSLTITVVLGALLLNASGNAIAAGFCPRFALHRDCFVKPTPQPAKLVKHESSCHHEMADMKMDGMDEADSEAGTNAPDSPEPASAWSSENLVLELPIESCPHCVIHSQPTSGNMSVVAIDPAKRLVEANTLPANFASGLPSAFSDLIEPSEHGPPGPSAPRHVLINVFRI